VTTWLQQIIGESNGRPFSQDELHRIVSAAEMLPEKLAAIKKMEDAQKWLVRQLSEHISPRAAEWGLPKDPFSTDFAVLLAAVGQALLCDDLDLVDANVVHPCVQLAEALELPVSVWVGLFEVAVTTLTQKLDQRSMELLKPYFQRAIDELRTADFQVEPASRTASAFAVMEV